ncbi:MAG: rod shape-determining protein RodA [Lachnospiraceae bacterium]|nr:rod shape-determining protein RodA [Lachnospiraceae bacterium]
MFRRYRLCDYDFKLILMILALSGIGVMTIGSAEPSLQMRQMAGVAVGTVIMVAISLINYNSILNFYWFIYLGNAILLALVLTDIGKKSGGAQRWVEIGGLSFQPSELAKILLILFFAQYIMKKGDKFNTFKNIASCIVLILLPWVLIYKQPDLSTSIMIIIIFCIIMFAGGVSRRLILAVIMVTVPTIVILVSIAMQPDSTLLKDYQKNRILAFRYPEEYADDEAYQQLNSRMAIASGMLDGKGYKNNEITSVKNGNFISEAETDFIFAVIGEEFGFKGSLAVIILITGISLECISISRRSKDRAGTVIAAAMGGLVAFQGFINIGVAIFILPNTGLPLPFVSYGLTSLMSLYIGMGFVLNVRLQAKRS